ncbi:MAG: hypothetical protein J3T61_12345, partial [Candidatus Brocadiales bacterium]|nr:hypothetical protein [Candidatus Bathyanammoxibius sp.]
IGSKVESASIRLASSSRSGSIKASSYRPVATNERRLEKTEKSMYGANSEGLYSLAKNGAKRIKLNCDNAVPLTKDSTCRAKLMPGIDCNSRTMALISEPLPSISKKISFTL